MKTFLPLIIFVLFSFQLAAFKFSMLSSSCRITNKKALKYYNEAISYLKVRNYAYAKQLLKDAIDKEEDFADAHYTLAEIARNEYDYRTAAEEYKRVISICPDFTVGLYFKVGLVSFESAKYDECLKYLNEFLERSRGKEKHIHRAKSLMEKARFLDKMYSAPVPFEPKSISGLSTPYDEYLPVISPDNELAFYTRRYIRKNKDSPVTAGDAIVEEFFFSRLENNNYSNGEPMKRPFNFGNNEGGATITIDNKHLYFTACNRHNSLGSCDIFHSEFKNGKWEPILNLGAVINSREWESQPSISSDGNTLFFASTREGGYGGSDIYMSVKDSLGNWSEIINLGPKINTPGNEKSPYIHQDDETLYFSSDGQQGMGGMDIFITRRNEKSKWSAPVNIGYPINSEEDDIGFFVSTDGKKGYFASNKYEGVGGWDIYTFGLYKEARPQQVLFLKGELKDEKGKPVTDAKIEMINTITNERIEIPMDSTGKYVMCLKFKNDFVMNVKTENKLPVTHYISVEDTAFLTPRTIDIKVKPIEVGQAYTMNSIYFATNSHELDKRSKFELSTLLEFMTENQKVKFTIDGHTDSIGEPEDNLKLSQDRSKSVFDYLVNKGINEKRLTHQGFGETQPIASNDTGVGRAKNRRTEFVITEK